MQKTLQNHVRSMIKHSVTETREVSVHERLPKKASEGFHCVISEGTIKYPEALKNTVRYMTT